MGGVGRRPTAAAWRGKAQTEWMLNQLGCTLDESTFTEIFDEVDSDGDGHLILGEFITAIGMLKQNMLEVLELEQSFTRLRDDARHRGARVARGGRARRRRHARRVAARAAPDARLGRARAARVDERDAAAAEAGAARALHLRVRPRDDARHLGGGGGGDDLHRRLQRQPGDRLHRVQAGRRQLEQVNSPEGVRRASSGARSVYGRRRGTERHVMSSTTHGFLRAFVGYASGNGGGHLEKIHGDPLLLPCGSFGARSGRLPLPHDLSGGRLAETAWS